MKGIFRIFSILILVAALAGGVVLVKRNQETRRGAASADVSSTVLPSTVVVDPGASFTTYVWLNTGKDTDSLQGAEVLISFDASKLNLTGFEPQNGYTALEENLAFESINKAGKFKFASVALGSEKAGAVSVAKLTFKAVGSGSAGVTVSQAKLMINGQSTTWDVAKNTSSSVTISGSKPTVAVATVVPSVKATTAPVSDTFTCSWCGLSCTKMTPNMGACTKIAPPEGKNCVLQGTNCVIVASSTVVPTRSPTRAPTATAAGSCGQRCTKDVGCGSGMVCTPIWWPCQSISTDLNRKLQENLSLDKATVAGMTTNCPSVARVLPTGYLASTSVRVPTFYGVCRNANCVNSTSCSCSTVSTTPRPVTSTVRQVTPTLRLTTATPSSGTSVVELSGAFFNPNVALGSEVMATVNINSNGLRVSAVNTQILYDTNYFDFVESMPTEGANVIKNSVDKATGKVTVYLTWSLPVNRLPVSPGVTTLKFKTKKVGTGTFRVVDKTAYASEVSGVDANGNSKGFAVNIGNSQYQNLIIADKLMCAECSSGKAKTTGNANCDAMVNSVDFEMWRSEMFDQGGLDGTVKSTWKSDFSCDRKVSGTDFEIWRKTVFQ